MSMYKFVPVTLTNLSSLQQSKMSFIIDQCSSLDISSGLVSDLHNKLPVVADDHVEDVQVNSGAEVVNIRDETKLFAVFEELLQ